ncbi:MAG: NUDIX hydrolase [Halocynthiibacter sp.]
MIRRFGEPRRPDVKYRHRPGAYAILPLDGQLLLTQQDWVDSELQLPGGGIDPGESPIAALHREVMEETGWRIANPRFLLTWRRFAWLPDYKFWAEKLCHIYVARPVRALGPPTEENHVAQWTSVSDAPDLLTNQGDAYAVSKYLDGSLIRYRCR